MLLLVWSEKKRMALRSDRCMSLWQPPFHYQNLRHQYQISQSRAVLQSLSIWQN